MNKIYWNSVDKIAKIFWTGISGEERMQVLNRLKACIDNYGFITDYHFFSDISVSMEIAIEERKIAKLYEDIRKIISLSDFNGSINDSMNERTILLNITFANGTGNLRVEVPAVPG